MQETQVRSMGQEDPLEKEIAMHSSILAWEIPWTEEFDRLQFMGSKRVGHNLAMDHEHERRRVYSLSQGSLYNLEPFTNINIIIIFFLTKQLQNKQKIIKVEE